MKDYVVLPLFAAVVYLPPLVIAHLTRNRGGDDDTRS
jgi:hypothetical protein